MKADYEELIEKYLSGELAGEELKKFKEALTCNAELSKEVEFHRKVDEAIMEEDIMELRHQMKTICENRTTEKKLFLRNNRKWYYIAASFAAAAGISGAFLLNKRYSNDRLVKMFYSPYEPFAIREAETPDQQDLMQAFQYYDQQKYKEALRLFESIFRKDQSNYGVKFYAAICYFEVDQYRNAVNLLEEIADSKNDFSAYADWYLGLVLLKMNKTDKAITQFEKVVASENHYSEKAADILRLIK